MESFNSKQFNFYCSSLSTSLERKSSEGGCHECCNCTGLANTLQWGSEIRPFQNRNHSKTGLFRDPIMNGLDFKWSGPWLQLWLWSQPFENRNKTRLLPNSYGLDHFMQVKILGLQIKQSRLAKIHFSNGKIQDGVQ